MALARLTGPATEANGDNPPQAERAAIIAELRAACDALRHSHETQCAIGASAISHDFPAFVQGSRLPKSMTKSEKKLYSAIIAPVPGLGNPPLVLGWMMTGDVITALEKDPKLGTLGALDRLAQDFPAAAFVIAERKSVILPESDPNDWQDALRFQDIADGIVQKEWIKRQLVAANQTQTALLSIKRT
jgi:hypothetical protein